MNALFNGEKIDSRLAETVLNRGFRFGDGCFETLLVKDGQCSLLHLHETRLKKSLAVLQLSLPAKLSLGEQLAALSQGISGWLRIRLWVWRSGGGFYAPESQEADFMLAATPCLSPGIHIKETALVSDEVRLMPSRWSFIKSISAQSYVMAALEKQTRAADELILPNHRGEIGEAIAANLFWKKRKRWYTPALSSGCVAGVMRSWLLQRLLEKGEPVFEVLAAREELDKVDKLVCTNVGGLQPIARLQEKQYDTDVAELWQLMPQAYQQA